MLTDLTDKRTIYLLGLLWADAHFVFSGSGGSIAIACVNDDSDTVKRICASHGLVHWKTRQAMRNGKAWGRLQFTMRLVMGDARASLSSWGFDTKESPSTLLNQISPHLRHYWWRGYFDGDGCFYAGWRKTEVAFWSTIDQDWTFVYHLFAELGHGDAVHTTQYNRKGGRHCSSATLVWQQAAIRAFLRYIYTGDDIAQLGFLRKHTKAQPLLSNPSDHMAQGKRPKRSKYRYVTWQGAKRKWRGFIWRLGKVDLGLFATEEEANEAVQHYLGVHDKAPAKSRNHSYTLDK